MQPQHRTPAEQLFPVKETNTPATAARHNPRRVWREELALLVLEGGQVVFTYRSGSTPCFA